MSIELVIGFVIAYLAVACFVFGKLDGTTPEPLRSERAVVAIFWPISVLFALVVVLIAFWSSRAIERSKR